MSLNPNIETFNSEDILNAIDLSKINHMEKKKRGRPKKSHQIMSNITKNKSTNNEKVDIEEEEIILHLPITKAEMISIDTNNISLSEILGENNEFSTETDEETSEKEIKTSDSCIKKFGMIIKKLMDENEELKKYISEITPMYYTEVRVYPVSLKLFEMNTNNQLIPVKTNICCFWCTYNFDTLPTYLPEKYVNGVFYVSGCFCSFNCKAAYNLKLGDDKIWERYSLIKLMYYMINKDKIKNINDIEINVAGPKELLERYGGPMTITEYRKNSKILGREYHKLIPPFMPLNCGYEEITNSKTNKNMNSIINSSNKNEHGLIHKRKNPINNIASKHIESYFIEENK